MTSSDSPAQLQGENHEQLDLFIMSDRMEEGKDPILCFNSANINNKKQKQNDLIYYKL